jgi:allophanate hydrolase subunit 2
MNSRSQKFGSTISRFLRRLRTRDAAPEASVEVLEGDALDSEKTRSEIRKLRVELQELRAWRSKLFFSGSLAVLAPLGSVVVFIAGWFGAHAAERLHENDDLYSRAATQLASPEAAVRLSAVITLDHFAKPSVTSWLGSYAEKIFASKDSRQIAAERPRSTMALLIA